MAMKENTFMHRVAELIVKLRWVFIILFVAAIVFSAFSVQWIQVENDIKAYLPDSSEAKQGLQIMNREFVTYGTADIMVQNVNREEAMEIYDALVAHDGVVLVNFDLTEAHYKDASALYSVTFNGPAESDECNAAMESVRPLFAGHKYYMYSDAFSNLTEIIVNEMKGVVVIVALVVVAVLIFTSSTYAEVLVLLGTFLAAAIINMGTNFLMGKISFVSNSVAIVLQLALSVDYAIIYCNRYKEEHKMKPIREAAIDALTMSIPEISASSLTTIAGLTAMTFMKFRLGFDMGVTLIKSIVCSLLSVFLLMPALLMCCGKLMDKTRHKNFVPKINFAGKFAYATRFIIPPLFVLLVVGAYFTFGNCNYAYSMDLVHTKRQNEQDIAANAIHERFGENNLVVVIVPSGSYEKEAELISELEACPEVNYALGIANIDAIGGYKLGDMVDYAEFSDIAGVDTITSQALFAYYAASQDEYRDASDDLTGYKVPLVDLFLFLRQVVGDAEVRAFLGAEAVGQLQQRLGHAAGDVGEDEVGQRVVGAAQAAGQHAQQLGGDVRVIVDPAVQQVGVHRRGGDLGDAHGRGGARAGVEDGQLAEHVGGAHDGQQVLAAVGGVAREFHLAVDDDVQAVARLTLVEDGGSPGEAHGFQLVQQVLDRFRVDSLEDSRAGEDLLYIVHGHVLLSCRVPESRR